MNLIPEEPQAALEVRMLDRFFDLYVMTPMQKPVLDSLRPAEQRNALGADCAAAPSLFNADWVHPIAVSFGNVRAYRQRLLARPSFARAVDEARPYRPLFPLGAPDRD